MDIAKDEFAGQVLPIMVHISESHSTAVDCEMTGVAGFRPAGGKRLDLQEFYEETKTAAEKFQILQIGIAIIKEDLNKPGYVVLPYNFNLSPIPLLRERILNREWSSTSGSMGFLASNGFQHDLPLTQGVQYLSRKEEHDARQRMIELDSQRLQSDMVLKAADEPLIKHIRTLVSEWLAQSNTDRPEYLNIPGEAPGAPETLNRYQIRLTHQIVQKEFPQLETRGMGHFVRITSPTEEDRRLAAKAQTEDRERLLNNAIGFRWIIEALFGGDIMNMPSHLVTAGLANVDLKGQTPKKFLDNLQVKLRERGKVLVGHNCFGDLIYIYQCFIGPLPDRVEDFAAEMNMLCPAIFDTKHIASFAMRGGDTSLGSVESLMQEEKLPLITVPSEYERYAHQASYHEAGFDALLTANSFIRLAAKTEREGKYLDKSSASDAAKEALLEFGESEQYFSAEEGTEEEEGSVWPPAKLEKEEKGGKEEEKKQLEAMVKRGEIMPRWSAGAFWGRFGNRLQTNASSQSYMDMKM